MKLLLTTPERKSLAACEYAIDNARLAWQDAGDALTKIRDERLYRASHKTFEDYCKDRWGIDKSYAHRLIGASAVVLNLSSPIGDKKSGVLLPTNESQVRALVSLPAARQREVWQQAVTDAEGAAPTASGVMKIASASTPQTLSPSTSPSSPRFFVAAIQNLVRFLRGLDLDALSSEQRAAIRRQFAPLRELLDAI